MKGYKALQPDMTSKYGNMTYELNVWYEIEGELEIHKNGFHFCERFEDIESFNYQIATSRLFEIETGDGEILEGIMKDHCCSSKIRLVREVPQEEIQKYFVDHQDEIIKTKDAKCRRMLAERGIALDRLLHDEDKKVRGAVAKQGYGLDVLVSDKEGFVRAKVAEQGYGLSILVKDGNLAVRATVAAQGYGLFELFKDPQWAVRAEVARQGYGLKWLIKDEHPEVRIAVAEQGFGLDILVNDPDWSVREAVAKLGYGLETLVHDKNKYVLAAVAKQNYGLDILVHSEHPYVRKTVAFLGYGLERLLYDRDAKVRLTAQEYILSGRIPQMEAPIPRRKRSIVAITGDRPEKDRSDFRGRPAFDPLTKKLALNLYNANMPVEYISKTCRISRGTLFNFVKEAKAAS